MSVLVGKAAPDFTANAVMGDGEIKADFNFAEHINGKYAVLFFYPLDFTFVCPSELIAFDHRIEEFTSRGVEVIGCSTDSHFTHKAWKSTAINNGGIGEVKYPLVADLKQSICNDYDVEVGGGAGEDGAYNRGAGIAYRASFLIDQSGVVRHQVVNDLPLGRNIDDETLYKALEIAQLGSVVSTLQKGLDTKIGKEGIRLSGGERQRLAIARMLVFNPNIIILDESTSALDIQTENHLFASLREHLKGKTMIIIAHRLSTIEHADLVYVIKEGRIVESGVPQKLLQDTGHFSDFVAAQR